MNSEQAFADLKRAVDNWVSSLIPEDYTLQVRKPRRKDTKVIRESVTGYQTLQPYEVLILDTPIFQRLRLIHQTALAYLVYPTAQHTRFDHSLGCAKIAQLMGEKLIPGQKSRIAELRLAGLLHDVGHAFFSHLSECIMQSHFRETYKALKNADEFKDLDLSLGEMMSYLIVKSPTFNRFLENVIHSYNNRIDVDNIARIIIHHPEDALAFMGDVISGPMDADKLDYLVRDCYFSGIKADLDVERVIVSIDCLDKDRFPTSDPEWVRRSLIMNSGGISVLEQVTFNRMLLYPSVYHHHKIRAIECMIKSIFEIIWEHQDDIRDSRLKFENIIDFYKLTDLQFIDAIRMESNLGAISDIGNRLINRDLFKRCLVLFHSYIEGKRRKYKWKDLKKLSYEETPEQIKEIRQWIYDELPRKVKSEISLQDVWVDIPKPPTVQKDADLCFIDIGTDKLMPLNEFFPHREWTMAYDINKLKGHVFSISDKKVREAVNRAAIKVFESKRIKFEERATIECKIR